MCLPFLFLYFCNCCGTYLSYIHLQKHCILEKMDSCKSCCSTSVLPLDYYRKFIACTGWISLICHHAFQSGHLLQAFLWFSFHCIQLYFFRQNRKFFSCPPHNCIHTFLRNKKTCRPKIPVSFMYYCSASVSDSACNRNYPVSFQFFNVWC